MIYMARREPHYDPLLASEREVVQAPRRCTLRETLWFFLRGVI